MNHVILSDSRKYLEKTYSSETAFENKIRDNSALIFGEKAIYLDTKNLVKTKVLGGVIPDGFLFDFRDARAAHKVQVLIGCVALSKRTDAVMGARM
jgi:hypothetical protein